MNTLNCIPDYLLIEMVNVWSTYDLPFDWYAIDEELVRRYPTNATFFFGDCAGQEVFVPIEPETKDGKEIFEVILYDDRGEPVCLP